MYQGEYYDPILRRNATYGTIVEDKERGLHVGDLSKVGQAIEEYKASGKLRGRGELGDAQGDYQGQLENLYTELRRDARKYPNISPFVDKNGKKNYYNSKIWKTYRKKYPSLFMEMDNLATDTGGTPKTYAELADQLKQMNPSLTERIHTAYSQGLTDVKPTHERLDFQADTDNAVRKMYIWLMDQYKANPTFNPFATLTARYKMDQEILRYVGLQQQGFSSFDLDSFQMAVATNPEQFKT